eukprot:SAG31_NODE_496_length_14862_cov_9.280837_20_plen_87_part_00
MAGVKAFANAGTKRQPLETKEVTKIAAPAELGSETAQVASAAIESLDSLLSKLEGTNRDGASNTAAEIAALRESMQSLGNLASSNK